MATYYVAESETLFADGSLSLIEAVSSVSAADIFAAEACEEAKSEGNTLTEVECIVAETRTGRGAKRYHVTIRPCAEDSSLHVDAVHEFGPVDLSGLIEGGA